MTPKVGVLHYNWKSHLLVLHHNRVCPGHRTGLHGALEHCPIISRMDVVKLWSKIGFLTLSNILDQNCHLYVLFINSKKPHSTWIFDICPLGDPFQINTHIWYLTIEIRTQMVHSIMQWNISAICLLWPIKFMHPSNGQGSESPPGKYPGIWH